jgi:asparagine synthase (glutamine-hydrolysing)
MALLLTMEAQRDGPEQLLGADARLAIRSDCDPFLAFRNAARRFAGHDPVQQMLLTDLTLQLPCQFLTKVDRATMAWGLEARVPLLDEIVGRLAVPLDSRFKVSGTRKKIVLRAAARGRVPDAILDGPKTGFGVPYGHWLRTTLAEFASDVLLQESFTTRFGMDRKRLEEELRAHRAGYDGRSFLLWKCLQLAIWHAERRT